MITLERGQQYREMNQDGYFYAYRRGNRGKVFMTIAKKCNDTCLPLGWWMLTHGLEWRFVSETAIIPDTCRFYLDKEANEITCN